jgi:CDP-4-dehydro-6-deoxyglucose reductase, E1
MRDIKEKIIKLINEKEEKNIFKYLTNLKNNDSFIPGISPVHYSGPYWDSEEILSVFESFLTGNWLSSGELVRKFEIQFSKKFNFKKSLMVNSGSSANLVMIAALKKYFEWKDDNEIIISCVGFPTTLNPIIQNNLKPIFVDIDFSDLNWDLNALQAKISDKTVGVFSSPVLGNAYNMDKLINICEKNNIKIIADNCDSLGSKWKNKYLTEYAVSASCSFYPAHHITTCEGGMVSSNNPEIISLARSFAWWGRDCYCVGSANLLSCGTCGKRFNKWIKGYDEPIDHKYVFTNIGYNLKPLDFQGAIGSAQIKKFDTIHNKRRINKAKIQKIIEKIKGVNVINELKNSETSWFGVPVICESKTIKQDLVSYLEKNNIQTRNYFAGNILMQPAYKHIENFKLYPKANQVLDRVFFIGCSPTLSEEMIDYIEVTINAYAGK